VLGPSKLKGAELTGVFADIFIGLNIIRALSIISLLLVFASSIVSLVHDVEAVNRFIAEGGHLPQTDSANATSSELDYIPYVFLSSRAGRLAHPRHSGSDVPHQAAGAFWAVVRRFVFLPWYLY
jgi:hypothetical protein